MKHPKSALGLACAVACLLSPAVTTAQTTQSITICYIADTHGQIEEHPELFWSGKKEEITTAGGVARIASAVKAIRNERPGQVLFFDAGDTIQGSGPAAWTQGEAVVPAMNTLGLDLAIPGNWEVIYGAKVLEKRAPQFNYPLIASNVLDAATSKPLFAPYAIQQLNGVTIGVVGFTDPDVPKRQPPDYSKGLRYVSSEVLQPLVDELRNKHHANAVVLLTHVGLPKAVKLAETLKGVDVVLSGDTHERTYEPIVRGNTWVVEPGSFGSFLGRLDLDFSKEGKLGARKWQLVELRADRVEPDAAVKQLVEQTLAPYRARMNKVIGNTLDTLVRYQVVDTVMDRVLSDALREAAGTQIALSNGFRFATPIMPGPVREGDLWNVYPIDTRLKVGKVTGKQLREFWEQEIENVFAADPEKQFGGWLPRVSGMTVRFSAKAPFGKRVREIRVAGKTVSDQRVYTIASCERDGDATGTLCRIQNVSSPQVLDIDAHEAVRRYLASHLKLHAPDTARVVASDLPQVLHSQFLTEQPQQKVATASKATKVKTKRSSARE